MNELLMKRIQRRLANLKDEQGYQVLDYVEFLETKYGTSEHKASVIDRITEGVEDTMRAGRLPVAAIRGTVSAMDSATKALDKLAGAGRAAVEELGKTMTSTEGTGTVSDIGAATDTSEKTAASDAETATDTPETGAVSDEVSDTDTSVS